VITSKLRRNEAFTFSWQFPADAEGDDQRVTLWMNSTIEMQFHFREESPPPINRSWLETMMVAANSAGGLRLTPEPDTADVIPSPFRRN
jgi:hypothetical protein